MGISYADATTDFRTASQATGDETGTPTVEVITLHVRILRELVKTPRVAHEKLARTLDVTTRTVQRHMEGLEREGFIAVDRARKPYTYVVQERMRVPHLPAYTVSDFLRDL